MAVSRQTCTGRHLRDSVAISRNSHLSSTTYTILRRIDPPEKCYLSEVLLWRAFGRFPEFQFDNSGKDWRFESDVRDGYRAPIPDGFELTEEECRYAGLPDDPQITALLEHGGYLDLEHYDRILTDYENVDGVARYSTRLDKALS